MFVLDWPREELYRRINTRVEAMFAAGLVEEVRRLIEGSFTRSPEASGSSASRSAFSRTAGQALGYREVIEHLPGSTHCRNDRTGAKPDPGVRPAATHLVSQPERMPGGSVHFRPIGRRRGRANHRSFELPIALLATAKHDSLDTARLRGEPQASFPRESGGPAANCQEMSYGCSAANNLSHSGVSV